MIWAALKTKTEQLNFRSNKDRDRPEWRALKARARHRSSDSCEFCGCNLNGWGELHHRWYPRIDTLNNLMIVHSACHRAIHLKGKIRAKTTSLAAMRDPGYGKTSNWVEYLQKNT